MNSLQTLRDTFLMALLLSASFLALPLISSAQGEIAFTSRRDGNEEIYVMNADGANQTRLTNNPARDFGPSFRTDGEKIAFASQRDGNLEIYVMDADGTNQTRFTNGAGSDYAPSFSPDGTKIVFNSTREGSHSDVYIMDADGTNQVSLTNGLGGEDPSFSPDGSKIVFSSGRSGYSHIYIMNTDGTEQTILTNFPSTERGPKFSPDGSKIVYYSFNFDIFIVNADGSDPVNLTNHSAADLTPSFSPDGRIVFSSDRNGRHQIYVMDIGGSNLTNLSNHFDDDVHPSWFGAAPPVTEKILFFSNRSGDHEVYVMDPDGSNQTNLSNNPSRDLYPAFSPDGSKIVFQSNREVPQIGTVVPPDEIWVMNSDGSSPLRLTNNSNQDFWPRFSPNGSKILFTSDRDGDFDIYIMDLDGSNVVQLTDVNDSDLEPEFSPDGSRIVFSSRRETGSSLQIYIMNSDGSNVSRLTHDNANNREPTFSPDGNRIMFSSDLVIETMNPDGTGRIGLSVAGEQPSYKPDGTKIVRRNSGFISVMNPDGSGDTALTNSGTDFYPSWKPLATAPTCANVSFDPTSLPTRIAGDLYSQRISAFGIGGQFTYAVTSGSLPDGLSLHPLGDITGLPTASGIFSFTVTASNAESGCTASQVYSLEIACPIITIDPSSLHGGIAGSHYGQSITTLGISGVTYAVTSGTLPNGVTLHPLGDLSGTPTESGSFNFTVTASSTEIGCSGVQEYTLEIACPLVSMHPSSPSLPNGNVDGEYSQRISAVGASGSYTYAVTSGSLPDGTSLHPLGDITGIPTASGTFSFTITATNSEIGCPTSQTYSITVEDNTPPVITPTVSGTLGNDGWYVGDVGVAWTVTDTGSEVSARDGCDEQNVTADSAGETFTCSATSGGGTSSRSVTVKRDTAAPVITLVSRTPANSNRWNMGDVDVIWSCSDALSGVTVSGLNQTVGTEGQNQNAIGSCEDNAGNTASDTQSGINIDKTPPNIHFVSRTAANAYGWNKTNVALVWGCSDVLSGVPNATTGQIVSAEGQNQSSTGSCADNAGNIATNVQNGINIDKTAPTLTPVVSPNPVLLGGSASTTSGAADSLSGLASESCGLPDTSTVGAKTVSCTASDKAGNTVSSDASYSVIYNFAGFFQPVDNLPIVNDATAGSSIPIKFSLNGDQGLSVFTTGFPASVATTCGTTAPSDLIEETVAAGGSSLSYDSLTDRYIYVWKTDKNWKGKCRILLVKLKDGNVYTASFRFR